MAPPYFHTSEQRIGRGRASSLSCKKSWVWHLLVVASLCVSNASQQGVVAVETEHTPETLASETCTAPSTTAINESDSDNDEDTALAVSNMSKTEPSSPSDDGQEEPTIEYGTAFGVTQETHSDHLTMEEVEAYLDQTTTYLQELPSEHSTNCRNHHEMCTIWAAEGFCTDDAKPTDPQWMTRHCGPACRLCEDFYIVHQAEGPGSNYGVVQVLEQDAEDEHYNATMTLDDLESTLEAAQQYMDTIILADPHFTKVRSFCYNYDPGCTIHALQGYCDPDHSEYDWMVQFCSPVCHTCHLLHYETRCPVDKSTNVWKAGDLDSMFRRIVEDELYETHIWSQPSESPEEDGPWIITIDNFLTDHEAQVLIQHGTDLGYEASVLASSIDEETGESLDDETIDDTRTSKNTWCSQRCQDDPVVKGVWQKLTDLTGLPQENSEELQLLKYEPGEYYELHHDNSEEWFNTMAGPRILTVFIYLSDVEEGGQTYFDHKQLQVNPKKGRVVLWPSVGNDDPSSQQEERTYHEAMPLIRGRKVRYRH